MGIDFQEQFKSSADQTMQPFRGYWVGQENPESPIPLVVCLHGKGVDHNAWFDFTTVKAQADLWGPCLVVSPFARGTGWYRGVAEQDVLDLVNYLQQQNRWSICPQHIYLCGHSMGGFGTLWISSRNPGIFAATSPMAGFAVDHFGGSGAGTNPLIIHDVEDEIVAVEESRHAAAWLSHTGVSHRYIETHGYGHSSTLISDFLPKIFAWFDEHTLSPEQESLRKRVVPDESPILQDWTNALTGLDQAGVSRKMANVIRLALGVDGVLVHQEDFTVQPMPVRRSTLDHLYGHPYAGISIVEMEKDAFEKLVAKITFSTPILSVEYPTEDRRLRVAIAESIMRRFAKELESNSALVKTEKFMADVLKNVVNNAHLIG